MTRVYNRESQTQTRRRLRREAPKAERLLWSRLRAGQADCLKFRRQYGVGPYVIDLFCPALKLAVEIDGNSHFEPNAVENDERRQAFIEPFGTHFVRFTNREVNRQLEAVLEKICQVVQDLTEQKCL